MKRITEPDDLIAGLFCVPQTKGRFRKMSYVLEKKTEDGLLLHNAVTGELVLLTEAEERMIASLPADYSPETAELIEKGFLVQEDYDEKESVEEIREVCRAMNETEEILSYNILPTTGCNARCAYCFESGWKHRTMTEETQNLLVTFIEAHCGPKKTVTLNWFGGEPTIAADRIDSICRKLTEKGITYRSARITTNGYLMTGEMIQRAKELWHLEEAQITLDGTEEVYNRVKAYPEAKTSPYRQVIENIHELLRNEISVTIRLNFDNENYENIKDLCRVLMSEFAGETDLFLYPHMLFGSEEEEAGRFTEENQRRELKKKELETLLETEGFFRKKQTLPKLKFEQCMADNDKTVTVSPDGHLSRCEHYIEEAVGTLEDGITEEELVMSWKEAGEYENCKGCPLVPHCFFLKKCFFSKISECVTKSQAIGETLETMEETYRRWKEKTCAKTTC